MTAPMLVNSVAPQKVTRLYTESDLVNAFYGLHLAPDQTLAAIKHKAAESSLDVYAQGSTTIVSAPIGHEYHAIGVMCCASPNNYTYTGNNSIDALLMEAERIAIQKVANCFPNFQEQVAIVRKLHERPDYAHQADANADILIAALLAIYPEEIIPKAADLMYRDHKVACEVIEAQPIQMRTTGPYSFVFMQSDFRSVGETEALIAKHHSRLYGHSCAHL